ncbi:MAG: hypothetical protein JWO64_2402 [Hyphomicrobiales bacterium]|nr:hypothetical protein [Hyphomicrobiales bacterium]
MNANRMLTAFFDNRTDAEEAISRLVQAGIPRGEINLVEGETRKSGASTSYEDTGFWATLSNLFMPDEDRHTYAEGLARGGHMVSVHTTDSQYQKALDILEDEGTINLDDRANEWKSEGWSGYNPASSRSATSAGGLGAGGLGSSAANTSRARTGEEVIPIAEERLNIGKREEIAGRVRVRSYVVETPVHEDVNLRQERVSVERRPVDRAVGGAEGAFKDRTIEATETSERAVVNKEARVTEEVVLHKDAQTRTESINDTVRKTKVEVEDDRAKRGTGTTGAAGTRKPV